MGVRDIIELIILFSIFIVFMIWIIYTIYSIKLSNRLKNHIIKEKQEDISLLDRIINYYNYRKEKIVNGILIENNTSKRDKNKQYKEVSVLVDSILSSLVLLIIYILISIFYLRNINLLSVIGVLIFGFIIPGFISLIKENIRKKEIEKDLLLLIKIINNNLQSGKTIKESLDDAKNKLNGYIKEELIELINDLDHGLSLDVAFKRMKDRSKVNDLSYLTATLSILSKTGGDINLAFSYLEKIFKTRKTLDQELISTTASSKLVFIILSILPVIVFLGMIVLYDNYLNLYITTDIGKLLGISEALLYLVYILVIKKVMRIEKY